MQVPKSSVLIYGRDKSGTKTAYPTVSVKNVFVFPGIPQLFKKSFDIICENVFRSQSKFYTKYIYLNIAEHQIVRALDVLIQEFPLVCIGSYPTLSHGYWSSEWRVRL